MNSKHDAKPADVNNRQCKQAEVKKNVSKQTQSINERGMQTMNATSG